MEILAREDIRIPDQTEWLLFDTLRPHYPSQGVNVKDRLLALVVPNTPCFHPELAVSGHKCRLSAWAASSH